MAPVYRLEAMLNEAEAAELPAFVEALARGEVPDTALADMIVDALRAAVAGEEGSVRPAGESEHLDFVNVVEVEGREDGVYVFAKRGDADRFVAAVEDGDGEAWQNEGPINLAAAAERLIASGRGDVLENMGAPVTAGDIRGGVAPRELHARLQAFDGITGTRSNRELLALLQQWGEEDARKGGR